MAKRTGRNRQGFDRAQDAHDAGPRRKPAFRRTGGVEHGEGEAQAPGAPTPRHGRQSLYGFHAVAEAIANPRRKVHRVFATPAAAQRLARMMPQAKVQPLIVAAALIDGFVGAQAVHQGIAAEVEPLAGLDLHDLPAEGVVLVLDQITDPHNVGAILRSAAAFGAKALIVTERHSAHASALVAKSASGAAEHVPLITVVNLAQALTLLGERGFWRIGLDSEGSQRLGDVDAGGPTALVLGAEGTGLRRLTRERCDALARLDMPGAIRSLNVSNAAAVALYALTCASAKVSAPSGR